MVVATVVVVVVVVVAAAVVGAEPAVVVVLRFGGSVELGGPQATAVAARQAAVIIATGTGRSTARPTVRDARLTGGSRGR